MFYSLTFLTFIYGFYSINCASLSLPVYRKAQLALKHYIADPSADPVTHSLLNVLIHDKNARAFTTDQAIEQAINSVKQINEKSNNSYLEKYLRQAVYGLKCNQNGADCVSSVEINNARPTPSTHLKQQIVAALDSFFSGLDNDEEEHDIPSSETVNSS